MSVTRFKTKFGMTNCKRLLDGYFQLTFDKPVALNGALKTINWVVSQKKLELIK